MIHTHAVNQCFGAFVCCFLFMSPSHHTYLSPPIPPTPASPCKVKPPPLVGCPAVTCHISIESETDHWRQAARRGKGSWCVVQHTTCCTAPHLAASRVSTRMNGAVQQRAESKQASKQAKRTTPETRRDRQTYSRSQTKLDHRHNNHNGSGTEESRQSSPGRACHAPVGLERCRTLNGARFFSPPTGGAK